MVTYPNKMHFFALGSSFFLSSLGTCMYAKHPNTCKWLTVGSFPYQASKDVLSSRAFVGLRLIRYIAVNSASAQNLYGNPESVSIDQTASTSVRFFRYSVLLRCLQISVLMLNAFLLEISFQLSGSVLPHCQFSTSSFGTQRASQQDTSIP